MKLTRDDLGWAASRGLITDEQANALWASLAERESGRPKFDVANVAYYFGALVVIGAMGWFVNRAWDLVDGFALSWIALAYALAFVAAGRTLWDRNKLRTPGGLLYVMAVCMTPLFVYGIERQTGWWVQGDPGSYRSYYQWIKGSWFPMEVATIAVGLFAISRRRFAFLTAPIAFSLWFLSMDVAPLLFGRVRLLADERELVSVVVGLTMLAAAYVVDLKARSADDYAFWGYLFGLMAFWGGLSAMNSNSELSKFIYCMINVALIGLSLVLRQRAFVVFGTLGVSGYLFHLAHSVFRDSLLFPLALSVIGILIIYLGVQYQRHAARIEVYVQTRLPQPVLDLVPSRARGLAAST